MVRGSAAAGVGADWANTIPITADAAAAAPAVSQVVERIRRRVSANGSGGRVSEACCVTTPSLVSDVWRFLRIAPALRRLTASAVTICG